MNTELGILHVGKIVFISFSEQYWDKSFTKKRHHVYDTRNVILKCEVTDIKVDEFKGLLFGNNGFLRDGEIYVFNNGMLLSNQEFTDFKSLGVWSNDK